MATTDSEIRDKLRGDHRQQPRSTRKMTRPARLTDDLEPSRSTISISSFKSRRHSVSGSTSSERVISTIMNDERFVRESTITDEGMEELRRQLRHRSRPLRRAATLRRFTSIFTVESVMDLVKRVLRRMRRQYSLNCDRACSGHPPCLIWTTAPFS